MWRTVRELFWTIRYIFKYSKYLEMHETLGNADTCSTTRNIHDINAANTGIWFEHTGSGNTQKHTRDDDAIPEIRKWNDLIICKL